jgi:hypothetical protein
VIVIGKKDERMEFDRILLKGLCEDAVCDGAEFLGGSQEVSTLESSTSDLDKRAAFGNEAKSSSHTD